MIKYFTKGGIELIKQANKYSVLRKYYDQMAGYFIFSEREYNENEDLRKEVVSYLKNAVAYTKDGKIDNMKTWILELIPDYDNKQDEFENDTWLYCIREAEVWG